ncbi:MAG: hypothetical protein PHV68_00840 [Candidatus Gastranaerophilales bacterium]|nr:hypothetical protein [Candidatus Gastranaerophilales bacterium]
MKNRKVKAKKPNRGIAKLLLEYLELEDCLAKRNMEALYSREIAQYLKWVDNYCNANHCTKKQTLMKIIEGTFNT